MESAKENAINALKINPMLKSSFYLLERIAPEEVDTFLKEHSRVHINPEVYREFLVSEVWRLPNWFRENDDFYKDKHILDVGGGSGALAIPFLEYGAASYTVVEMNPKRFAARKIKNYSKKSDKFKWIKIPISMQEIADQHPGLIHLVLANFLEFNTTRKFDFITLYYVTEYLENVAGTFSRVYDLLNDNGIVLGIHHNFYSFTGHHQKPWQDFPEFSEWRDIFKEIKNVYLNRISLNELRNIMEKNFVIERWIEMYSPPERGTYYLNKKVLEQLSGYSLKDLLIEAVCFVLRKKN